VDTNGQQSTHVASGVIDVRKLEGTAARLEGIYTGVKQLVESYKPHEMAVERVFVSKNADSALKLGQARAAAICASFGEAAEFYEYAAREVKQAVVGRGAADKSQVQHMVQVLLGLREALQEDAADALGVALCHAHMRTANQRLAEAMQ
jgi:crossover junction endodeoxyribonuclease RuvC